ncbi:transcription activator of gluconeogenesis ERT1 [Acrasis kona]|uniref:Transcription activator of gluconeogenesis ERT1 n=1 Tax=Acrasis kona TaxID=1008807 RepID=A0AAW2YUF0_9EUKA
MKNLNSSTTPARIELFDYNGIKKSTTPSTPVTPSSSPVTGSEKKKINHACTECRKAHKACSGGRPCERCIRTGLSDKCQSSPRKKRVLTKKSWTNFLEEATKNQNEEVRPQEVVTPPSHKVINPNFQNIMHSTPFRPGTTSNIQKQYNNMNLLDTTPINMNPGDSARMRNSPATPYPTALNYHNYKPSPAMPSIILAPIRDNISNFDHNTARSSSTFVGVLPSPAQHPDGLPLEGLSLSRRSSVSEQRQGAPAIGSSQIGLDVRRGSLDGVQEITRKMEDMSAPSMMLPAFGPTDFSHLNHHRIFN